MPRRKASSGSIQEEHSSSTEIRFAWKIPRFFSSDNLVYAVYSPAVQWLGGQWIMTIYPNGRRNSKMHNECVGLSMTHSPRRRLQQPFRMTFGIQKVNKTEEVVLRDRRFAHVSGVWQTTNFLRRSELLKREHQLNSSGALTVTCTIRVSEEITVEGNPYATTNLGSFGDVRETFRKSNEIGFQWKIPHMSMLPDIIGDYYCCSDVEFLNTRWNLRIYPNGHAVEGLQGWIGLDVLKVDLTSSQKLPVLLTLGVKEKGKKERILFQDETLVAYRRLWSAHRFIQKSELVKLKVRDVLTVTCKMRVDEKPPVEDACTETSILKRRECVGDIRETYRIVKEIGFEWTIPQFSSLLEAKGRYSSPIFEFHNSTWRLKIYPNGRDTKESQGWMGLDVWKVDWSSCQKSVYLSFGIKKADSTDEVIVRNQKLPEHGRLWRAVKFLSTSELSRRECHIVPSDVLTVTCTIGTEEDPSASDNNFQLHEGGDGTIRERECNFHKEIEWDVDGGEQKKDSPAFVIGSQRYNLELEYNTERMVLEMNLNSWGPPIGLSESALWWAGMKHHDGSYILSNTSGVLNVENINGVWKQKCLYSIKEDSDLHRQLGISNHWPLKMTFFLRISVDRTPSSVEACSHGTGSMLSETSFGFIRSVDCAFHKEVKWDVVDITSQRSYRSITARVTSAEFSIESRSFKFECFLSNDIIEEFTLNLYSRLNPGAGPISSGRWWVGLKCSAGIYSLQNMRGEMNLKDEPCIWTLRGSLKFQGHEFDSRALIVVFWYYKEEGPSAGKECNHGIIKIPLRSDGDIREEEFTSYKHIEWSFKYKAAEFLRGSRSFISPEFVMGNQRYVLQLFDGVDESLTLNLCRRGSPVTGTSRFVRWWAGVKRSDGAYDYKNRRGKLDLSEECMIWTQIYLYKLRRGELEDSTVRTIFIRLSENRTWATEKACTKEWDNPLPDSKRQRIEDSEVEVVFQVQDVKFKFPRATLGDRFPVLNAMFQHDTVEKRTGVVTIEDSEPAAFGEFLHYISTGFLRELTEHNAHALYMLADKYLLDDLKAESLQCVADSISVHTFCDTFTLALTYEEEDLFNDTIDFFSRNYQNIMKTDSWPEFYKNNRAIAYKLHTVMFKPRTAFKHYFLELYRKRESK